MTPESAGYSGGGGEDGEPLLSGLLRCQTLLFGSLAFSLQEPKPPCVTDEKISMQRSQVIAHVTQPEGTGGKIPFVSSVTSTLDRYTGKLHRSAGRQGGVTWRQRARQ